MLSLLRALLFRPHAILEHILKNPSSDASSRLSFVIVVLTMIGTAIVVGAGLPPNLDKYMGAIPTLKWLLVLIAPPIQFVIQRFLYLMTARLGLLMIASHKMPPTREERREKARQLRYAFPYIIYPMTFFSLISAPFISFAFVQDWFFILGMVYYFLLSVFTLRTLYGVSNNVAFWSPILVQFLLVLIVFFLLTLLAMLGILAGIVPDLQNPIS